MKALRRLYKSTGKVTLGVLCFLAVSAPTFAQNAFDSDSSNQAGSNENWHSVFWFLCCVTLLIAVFVIGQKTRYVKVSRKYYNNQR